MEQSKKKIFAFYGYDLEGYPDNFLKDLEAEGYGFLALDLKAIEFASVRNLPYTIINDWLDTNKMLEIRDIAHDFENNWFKPVHEKFTSHDICWPEFDHFAMRNFWFDTITSLKLSDAFRKNNLQEVLIVKQEEPGPMVFYQGFGVHKNLWETELTDILKIIDSRESRKIKKMWYPLKNTTQYILLKMEGLKRSRTLKDWFTIIFNSTTSLILGFLSRFSFFKVYLSPEGLTGKIVFLASYTELSRSNNLLKDLITTFPKKVVIIPHQIPKSGAYHVSKKWKVPVIEAPENDTSTNVSETFLSGYQKLIKLTKNKLEIKIFMNLQFHFLYYCQNRWPIFDSMFENYIHLFSKYPPSIIIGAAVNQLEWNIPILAAKRCGIETISIPHGVWSARPAEDFPLTVKKPLFNYDLYLYPISKQYYQHISRIEEKKLIGCKNCTDIDSHRTRQLNPEFSQNSWKILVLFNPTTFAYPDAKYPPIHPIKNPEIQMDTIRILHSPPEDLKEKTSIKFKVHPNYSELELFTAVGGDVIKDVLPPNTQLKPVLDEADLVVGVNYFGSALFHAVKNYKPVILIINDDLYEKSCEKEGTPLELPDNGTIIVRNPDELWDVIRNYFTNPVVSEKIKSDVTLFSKQFLNNSTYPTIATFLKDLLSEK